MKERVRERAHMLSVEAKNFGYRMAAGDTTCLSRKDRTFIVITTLVMMVLLAAATCFAAGDGDLISQAGDMANEYYTAMFGIVTGIAGLAAIICLIWIAASPTANGARTPLEWLKRILVSYACIMLLGGIFALIRSLTSADENSVLPE